MQVFPGFRKSIVMMTILLLFTASTIPTRLTANPPEPKGASLSGYVEDAQDGEPLIGATVMLKGTKKGAYTNKAGFYSIRGISPGEYTVVISMMGYEKRAEKIKFTNKSIRKTFEIKVSEALTEEVVVTAESEVERREIAVSRVNIPVKQLKEIRIGGEADVFRSLQMLPGVLSSSQISSGLYIRGGSPDQNLVLLDGSVVYNPTHLFGFISTFNADAVKDVELIKGGYPAEYAGRLSAVLNVTQKDGNKEEFEGMASLGLISSKLSLETPFLNGALYVGGRRTYFDIIKPLLGDDPDNPIPDFGFYDLNAKLTQDLGPDDKIYLSGFLSNDNFDMTSSGMDINMYMGNRSGSFRWQHLFGDDMFSSLIFSASHYKTGFKQDISGYEGYAKNTITDYTIKGNLEWFTTDDLTLKTGFSITNYKFTYDQDFTGGHNDGEEEQTNDAVILLEPRDWIYGLFFQANYFFTSTLSMQGGFRLNYWDDSDNFTHDPRVSLKYNLNEDVTLKASWGIYHQYLRLATMENFSIFDTWLPNDGTVDASKATHYIFSMETKPWENYLLNFDVYYKDLQHISELNMYNMTGTEVKDVFFDGSGEAYGAEIFLQRKIGNFVGWIGYGLGWVNAQFDDINEGREFRPKYDRRHDLKIVAQYEYNKTWNFGMSFTFQSGQSYTGASSRFQTFLPGQNHGKGLVVPTDRYGLRLPPSHQLNVSVGYSYEAWGAPQRLILDIYNLYSRRDILMRRYDNTGDKTEVEDVLLLPILPTFSWEIKF